MKRKLFSIFIISSLLFIATSASLQGPESELIDKSKQFERKSAKGLGEKTKSVDETTDITDEKAESTGDKKEDKLEFILSESGIKIIRAPDLSKNGEEKKVSETLSLLLANQEKWIQKIEDELEDLNKKDELEQLIPKEKSAEEIEGMIIYIILILIDITFFPFCS